MSRAGMEDALRTCLWLSMHRHFSDKRNLMMT